MHICGLYQLFYIIYKMYIYYTLRYNVKSNEVVSMLNEWCKFLNLFLCDLYTLCKLSGKKNFMIKILILILLHITSDYLILKFVMKKLLSLRVLKFPSMIKLNFSNGLYSLSIFHIEIYKYFSPRNIFQKVIICHHSIYLCLINI